MIEGIDIRLKILRHQTHLTQKQVAERIGIDPNTLSSYEKGDSMPSAENIRKLARFYNTSSDYVLALDDRETIDLDKALQPQHILLVRQIVNSALELIEN